MVTKINFNIRVKIKLNAVTCKSCQHVGLEEDRRTFTSIKCLKGYLKCYVKFCHHTEISRQQWKIC